MGYFDFVAPDLGPDEVADDEATNAENRAFEESHKAAAKNPVKFNLDEETDTTHKFQKERSKLADFAKKQAIDSIERLAAARDSSIQTAAAQGKPTPNLSSIDVEGLKQKIVSSSPDQYANIIHSVAVQHGLANDQVLKPLEDAVQNYKRLTIQQQPQVGAQIQSSLSQQDLPNKQARAQQLDQEIDKANKDLQIAASPRQAQQTKEYLKFLNDQKRSLGSTQPQEPTTTEAAPNLDLKGDIDSNIKAAGRNPKDFRLAMVAAAKTLEEKTGLDTMALKDRVPFQRALLSALQIFDPAGIIVSQLAQDMQPSAPPAQTGGDQKSGTQTTGASGPQGQTQDVSFEEDQHTQNIRRMQADRRQLYNELGQTPELQSWLGVLTFVFLSVITRSPAVAASILGISRRQGNLKMQLDLIEKEMHEEGGMLRDAQKRTEFTRKLAAEHSLRRQDKADDFQLELQKMYLNHKLILERQSRLNPENKNAYKQLENSFVRQKQFYDKAQHKKDEAQRILSNDFSDEGLKVKAQKDFDAAAKEMKFYESRLRDLDLEIRRHGGIQFQDEVPAETNQ